MRVMKPADTLEMLQHRRERAMAEAEAVSAKREWAYETLQLASKQLEEVRRSVEGDKPTELEEHKLNEFGCNLADAARAFTKADNRNSRAWGKYARAKLDEEAFLKEERERALKAV